VTEEYKTRKYNNYKSWKEKNRARANKLSSLSQKKSIENLSDAYVKLVICQGCDLKRNEIPKELIEVKRISILINRKLKETRSG